jgi:hypothetical protein
MMTLQQQKLPQDKRTPIGAGVDWHWEGYISSESEYIEPGGM